MKTSGSNLRRIVLATFLSILLIGAFGVFAQSKPENFPNRPVEIVVPYNVGGGTDIYVRTLAKALESILKVRLEVVNITGGQNVPAVNKVLSEPADGHTILAIGDGDLINTVLGYYDYRKITPVACCQRDQGAFWVPTNSPFKDFDDVLEAAKKDPDTTQKWTGGLQFEEILVHLFAAEANLNMKYIPYADSTQANAALAGGFYDLGYEEIGPMLGLYRAGKVRPLVVLTEERLPGFPEIPTAREYGVDVTLGRWRGLGVKAGTPQEIIAYLEAAVMQAMQDTRYIELTKETVTDQRPGFSPSAELQESMDEDFVLYKELMTGLGMVK